MKVKVLNTEGKPTGRELELSDAIFGIEPHQHSVYLSVKQFMANNRQGTHKAKERSEIARTTKKAFRQKGTGGARRGDMKSPLVRGGGRVFGPKPHDYNFKLNKKVKDLAKKSLLSDKVKTDNLIVLEDFNMDKPQTKGFVNILNNLGVAENKTMFVLAENNYNVYLSSRNYPSAAVVTADKLNAYEIINAQKLVLTESSVKKLEDSIAK